MLPWILGGLAAAGIAYLIARYLHRKEDPPFELPDPDREQKRREAREAEDAARRARREREAAEAQAAVREAERRKAQAIRNRDELINKIVRSVTFASQFRRLGSKVTGEELVPSLVPADDINIRPMQGFGELPRTLSRTQALPEEVFYGQAAANQLPVMEHIERVELREDVWGPTNNVLLVLQDVSPSMWFDDATGNHHIDWAVRLNERIIDKCIKENASYVVVPFGGVPTTPTAAKTAAECAEIKRRLPDILEQISDTHILNALNAGIEYVQAHGFDEARMLLVTDGDPSNAKCFAFDADEVAEQLKKLNIHLHTVCIGGDHPKLRRISEGYDLLHD
jgi:hypothetical protein